jgi:alanine racemase
VSPGAAVERTPGRPTLVRVDLAAFAHNLALARRLAGPERRVMAVLKADGYGHGAVALAREAARGGAAFVGVATAGEARELRNAGIELPILILSEVPPTQAAEIVRLGCAQVVYTLELAEALEREAARDGRRVPVHIKVDTGMGRVGLAPEETLAFVARLRELPHLALEGVMSHLAEADVLESPATGQQLELFRRVLDGVREIAGEVRWRHIANSALLLREEDPGNLARPGIMLYGSAPGPGLPHAGDLRPVLRFETAVSFLKRIPAGAPLGYGGTFVTGGESLIATIPVGYADGYRRALSNRGEVLVRGRRAPVVGTVCMDLCLVDVTAVPGVRVGDQVVLIGRQGEAEVSADELAGRIGTISYEVFCGIGRRVPRWYSGGSFAYHESWGGYRVEGARR